MSFDWNSLQKIITDSERFLLTCHVRPDCDAIGSELAFAELLDACGKETRIVNADPVPPRLAFIDPSARIDVLPSSDADEQLGNTDVIVVLDTSAWGQLGAMGDLIRRSPARVVVIDHHAGESELECDLFKDAKAEATGRMVYDFANHLGIVITQSIATSLFAAIATDTGWFRFPSTKSSTHLAIADLISAGAEPDEIFRQLYEQDSIRRVKLRSIALANITLELEGRLAHTFLLNRDFDLTSALQSETEDFINMAMTIAGTEVAMMLTEQADNRFKLSLRSRSNFDCNKAASAFGGGGHQKAAGATIDGTFQKVQSDVLAEIKPAIGR